VFARPAPVRRPGFAVLVLIVTAAHLWLGDDLMEDRLGFGASSDAMRRIEVAYVRELAVAPPPEVAPTPRPQGRTSRSVAAKPARPASAPASAPLPKPMPPQTPPEPVLAQIDPPPVVTAPDPAPPIVAAAPTEAVPAASEAAAPTVPAAPATPASAPAVAAAEAPAFEWPPSTRLTYTLAGNYRGEVQGRATVEWIRVGLRYQVHLEALIGPPFAPLLTRRVSSDGELGERGLSPRRFEGEQRVAFRSRRWSMTFEPDRVMLPGGLEAPTMPGVQDEASLFVQLTWIFTTQPQMLQVGKTIEIPLALPRRVETWQYDVVAAEVLQMSFATLPTMHVKPRRPGRTDISAEIWFAPSLQYLPVRILIQQDAQTFVDLMLERPPQQALGR
jgi:Protein of unknown function (DUF3108)